MVYSSHRAIRGMSMRYIPVFQTKSLFEALFLMAAGAVAIAIPFGHLKAGDELAINPFNPDTIISQPFKSAPLQGHQPPAPQPVRTAPTVPPSPAPTLDAARDNIVLEINLEIDRNRASIKPKSAPPSPRAPSTLFDFSKTTATPVTLSVPSEGTPVPPYRVRRYEPEKEAAKPKSRPLPFTAKTASINISEPETIPSQSDSPVFLGTSVYLGDILEDTSTCFVPDGARKRICVIKVDWPEEMAHLFEVSSIFYRGQGAIVRLDDDGRTEAMHGLIPAEQFKRIAGHFTMTFGPAEEETPLMALIGDPTARNLVLRWKRMDEDGVTTVLELRAQDDLRDILPDETHGAVRLYHEGGVPIFTYLQTTDFLLRSMRADAS